MFSALFGAIIGGFMSLIVTFYFKERDASVSSLNSAKMIEITLCEQISTLANVGKFIDVYEAQKKTKELFFSKQVITRNLLKIDEKLINQFYTYYGAHQHKRTGQIIIGLTIAQRLYDEVFQYVDSFNKSLSPEILEKMSNLEADNTVKMGLLHEVFCNYEGVKYKYEELKSFHIKLKKEFDSLCEEIYFIEPGLCSQVAKFYRLSMHRMQSGETFKPLKVADKIVQSSALFEQEKNN